MVNKGLYFSFNTYDKNLLFVIYHQARKYRLAALF